MNAMAPDHTSLESRIRRHFERGEIKEAVTGAVEGFGPEILGFLVAVVRDERLAGEIFSQFCQDLWTGMPAFRGKLSFRTWAYRLARNAWLRLQQEPRFQRTVSLSDSPHISNVEKQVKTLSLPNAQSEAQQQVMKLRKSLDPEDQALLILHIDRRFSWNEIVQVMIAPEESSDQASVARHADALRARFELVTRNLKQQARENKLLVDE
jgi:RNA polymerase sigma-70 factor (ECF subfamily)